MEKMILVRLIDEVVIPFERYLLRSEIGRRYLDTPQKRQKHNLAIVELVIAILNRPDHAKTLLQKGAEAHHTMEVPAETMRRFLTLFFALLRTFVCQNASKACYERLEREYQVYEEFFMQAYQPSISEEKILEEIEDGGFLDFDSEEVDGMIDQMHYQESQKIDATTFMQEEAIDHYMIDEIDETIDEILNFHDDEVGENYKESYIRMLDRFGALFRQSIVFENLAYALDSLKTVLKSYRIDDPTKEMLLRQLLDAVLHDLDRFNQMVLKEQSAVDIHYLDASLLANVAQIEMMIQSNN